MAVVWSSAWLEAPNYFVFNVCDFTESFVLSGGANYWGQREARSFDELKVVVVNSFFELASHGELAKPRHHCTNCRCTSACSCCYCYYLRVRYSSATQDAFTKCRYSVRRRCLSAANRRSFGERQVHVLGLPLQALCQRGCSSGGMRASHQQLRRPAKNRVPPSWHAAPYLHNLVVVSVRFLLSRRLQRATSRRRKEEPRLSTWVK